MKKLFFLAPFLFLGCGQNLQPAQCGDAPFLGSWDSIADRITFEDACYWTVVGKTTTCSAGIGFNFAGSGVNLLGGLGCSGYTGDEVAATWAMPSSTTLTITIGSTVKSYTKL